MSPKQSWVCRKRDELAELLDKTPNEAAKLVVMSNFIRELEREVRHAAVGVVANSKEGDDLCRKLVDMSLS